MRRAVPVAISLSCAACTLGPDATRFDLAPDVTRPSIGDPASASELGEQQRLDPSSTEVGGRCTEPGEDLGTATEPLTPLSYACSVAFGLLLAAGCTATFDSLCPDGTNLIIQGHLIAACSTLRGVICTGGVTCTGVALAAAFC